MKQPSDWPLLAQYLSGECSRAEQEQVEAWLDAAPENRRLLDLMQKVWRSEEPQRSKSDVEALWNQVAVKAGIAATPAVQQLPKTTRPAAETIRWPARLYADSYRLMRYAAVFFVVVSLGYVLSKMTGVAPWQLSGEKTLTVDVGDRKTLNLDDGTKVVLDAGSTLRYPSRFDDETREVYLAGEGYFEVAPDAARPFVVHANHADVRVLGTKFNIRAWQPDEKVTVAVTEGRVALRAATDTVNSVVITKGELSLLPIDGTPTAPEAVDIDKYLGWMRNEFFFDNAPLSEILFQLQRWYEVDFVLADSSLAHERLNIHIKNKSLGEVLELLTVLTDMQYQREGKTVRLRVAGGNN